MFTKHLLIPLLILLLSAACTGGDGTAPPPCQPLPPARVHPTATRIGIFVTATPIPDTQLEKSISIFCTPQVVTPEPTATTAAITAPENMSWQIGNVRNLTLSLPNETLLTSTASDHASAILWREGKTLHIAESRPESPAYAVTAQLDVPGDIFGRPQGDLAYDGDGQLHLISQASVGLLRYRHTLPGLTLAESLKTEEELGLGFRPQIEIDRDGNVSLVYEAFLGSSVKEMYQQDGAWYEREITSGDNVDLSYSEAETNTFLVAVGEGDSIQLLKKVGTNSNWTVRGNLSSPYTIISTPQITIHENNAAVSWLSQDIDSYYVEASVSNDGGDSWSAAVIVGRNEYLGDVSGIYSYQVVPILYNNQGGVQFLTIYEAGDPPPENPDQLRLGQPTSIVCLLDLSDCLDAPGNVLVADTALRPTTAITAECNPSHSYCTISWRARQPDVDGQDVYTTILTLE